MLEIPLHLLSERQLPACDIFGEVLPPYSPPPSERNLGRLMDACTSLTPKQWEAVTYRYWAGLSFRKIAAIVGVDEKAIRKRHALALKKLRSAFSESA